MYMQLVETYENMTFEIYISVVTLTSAELVDGLLNQSGAIFNSGDIDL